MSGTAPASRGRGGERGGGDCGGGNGRGASATADSSGFPTSQPLLRRRMRRPSTMLDSALWPPKPGSVSARGVTGCRQGAAAVVDSACAAEGSSASITCLKWHRLPKRQDPFDDQFQHFLLERYDGKPVTASKLATIGPALREVAASRVGGGGGGKGSPLDVAGITSAGCSCIRLRLRLRLRLWRRRFASRVGLRLLDLGAELNRRTQPRLWPHWPAKPMASNVSVAPAVGN
mmetsp:Transcript_66810/g.186465  ORF Transcript_66810/g.186465 Transcript_66810/m.186465 type:complete len:232 (-) Transcript_66810:323-1018(-)